MMLHRISILLIIPTMLTACGGPEEKVMTEESAVAAEHDVVKLSPKQLVNAAVQTSSVEEVQMYTSLKVNGKVEAVPQNVVSLTNPLGGFIKTINLIPGTRVKKGQVLFTMEDQQYIQLQQDYLTAKSKLKFLETDLKRQKQLNETKASSDKVLQQVQNDFESQEILLRSLGQKLQLIGLEPSRLSLSNISHNIRVVAPMDGFVTAVNVNAGRYVNPPDVICELVNPKDFHITLTVFEKDAVKLQPGQKVIYFAGNDSVHKYSATVHLVSPAISNERTTEVHCDIENASGKLLPGMFVNAEIQLDKIKVAALPEDAVVKWNNKTYVFVEEDTATYRMTAVETGSSANGYVEITSTLPDKNIATANAYTLLTKLKNGEGEE